MPHPHPLDPLDAAELTAVVGHARATWGLSDRHLFAFIQLDEPSKPDLERAAAGHPLPRTARVTVLHRDSGTVAEGRITTDGQALDWQELPGAHAPVLSVESEEAMAVVRADPRVRAALALRGVTDVNTQVHLETWPMGAHIPDYLDDTRRLVWTPMWLRPYPTANVYAHPINGVYAIVDLQLNEVVAVEDHGVTPTPMTPGDWRLEQSGGTVHLKGLEIQQPEGPSFRVDGWRVDWERWSLRVGWDQREGLVIHDVWFDDAGKQRKIAHRLSIAELVIPYGDPSQGTYRKNAFDTGEYGLGNYTNSLTLGCDCLGEIAYLSVALADPRGQVRTIENAICMHEEDFGILWKHIDIDGHVEVRRGRRFVVSSIVTINNYEYGYFWYFYQDGAIEFEAKLTGIVLTLSDAPGVPHPSATQLEEGLWAPYHQHTFCARLDLDIDGQGNTVYEVDAVAEPMGPGNPHGAAYVTRKTPVTRERDAARLLDLAANRYWTVANPSRRNHVGGEVGYKLVGNHNTLPMASPESVIGRRAGFMYRHLWVTRNDPTQRYPAGDFPFQHVGGAGLPEWVQADRNLTDTDVVLWYVFGVNHIPRLEDWPVMPVERLGFTLKPNGFFRRSPAMDVAPSPARCCASHGSCTCGH